MNTIIYRETALQIDMTDNNGDNKMIIAWN